MALAVLTLFAFLAGAATAVSPCILPVLPIALSAGATGGNRRPFGIVLGLTASFTVATILLVYVIDALGLPDALVRTLAIVVLVGFGVALVVPALAARVEGALSRLTRRMPVPSLAAPGRGSGLRSGIAIGLALGVVYAPCAGPILAAVITTSAAQELTVGRVAVALAYGLGTGVVLYALMRGGRRLTRPLAARSGRFQQAAGVLMLLMGLAMLGDLDLRFQQEIATALPAALVNPTGHLEADATEGKLTRLRGTEPKDVPKTGSLAAPAETADDLPDLGAAPDFVGNERWWNTPGDRPLTLAGLRGRVVLLDFWTYSCINCIRTFPELKELDARYRAAGLTVVGVHSPEFTFERGAGNVGAAIGRYGLRYPVAQDNAFKTWDAWGNLYWPAQYLVDAKGRVRYRHAGEGGGVATEAAIRALLTEAGASGLPAPKEAKVMTASSGALTPESYVGAGRADRFASGQIQRGTTDFGPLPVALQENFLAYGGQWAVTDESATAGTGAALAIRFHARRVYLVMTVPGGGTGRVGLTLDGRPVPSGSAGADVHGSAVTVRDQRLYTLLDLPAVRTGRLELHPAPGVQVYAFTFG